MRKKNVLVIILTLLVFLSAVTLGVSTVYRVDYVNVKANMVSEEAKTEAAELERRLTAAYKDKSIFSLSADIADGIIEEFPYFRRTSFSCDYPNRLIVSVTEDMEAYAVPVDETAQNYYILGIDGTVLGIRSDMTNRSGKVENILVKGLTVTGKKGSKITGDSSLAYLFSILNEASSLLGGAISRNVVEVEVLRPTSAEEETTLKLSMREGINVYIRNPGTGTQVKTEKAIGKYLELTEGSTGVERLTGMIVVWGTETEATAHYEAQDIYDL